MRFLCIITLLAVFSSTGSGAVLKKHKGKASDTLINGTVVTSGYDEVVMLRMGGAVCTGTLLGPKIVLTAAHCVETGQTASFSVKGVRFAGKGLRSDKYPAQDHDIAVVLLEKQVQGIKYASVGGKAARGSKITLLGYGCTDIGGKSGVDGKLRWGRSTIIGYSGYDMVSRMRSGAALCFGDSGGPAFSSVDGDHILLGVNSKGNIRDTNYNTRLDISVSQDFLNSVASKYGITICGVNKDCTKPKDAVCRTIFFEASEKMDEYRRACLAK